MKDLSVVVPVFNEADGIESFFNQLVKQVNDLDLDSEIIFCNDGSTDNTATVIKGLVNGKSNIKLLSLSSHFGKENALTAGIAAANARAIITIDGDGQHPVELIPKFIEEWRKGNKVVVGIRQANKNAEQTKQIGSKVFYSILRLMGVKDIRPGSTDFRLIDRDVQKEFLKMPERDRFTRGLIDWLGFKRSYIYFQAKPRAHGKPSYKLSKLFKLAASGFVSRSPSALFIFSYLGGAITGLSALLGITVIIEQLILGDPLHWKFTGTAMLGILIIFLVGLVLISQGIMSLYISHIHSQSMQRPLYVIDYDNSVGIKTDAKTD